MKHSGIDKVCNKATKVFVVLLFFCLLGVCFSFWESKKLNSLVQKLKDKDPLVRADAAKELEYIVDNGPALEPLIEALKDEEPLVRRNAARTLREIKGTPPVERIIESLKDGDLNVREEVALTLKRIGRPAVEPLINALRDQNLDVRMKAAWTLGEIKDTRIVKPLMAALENENLEIVAGAQRFFIHRGEPGTETCLIKALNKYGDRFMAEKFLNCGNSQLEKAARRWAERQGYTMLRVSSPGRGKSWGSGW